MPYALRLPDGSILKDIPDNVTIEEAKKYVISAGLIKESGQEAGPTGKRGLIASAIKGAEGVIGSSTTALKSITGSPEEAALEGLKRQQETANQYEDTVSLERVKEAYRKKGLFSAAGEALSQVPYALAEQAANIGVSAASGMAGAKVGALAGAPLGPVGSGAGAVIGGITGAFLPSFAQQYGGNIERQAAEQQKEGKPIEIDRGKAAIAGAVQGAAETAATLIPLGRTAVGKILGPEVDALLKAGKKEAAEKLAQESLAKVVTKGVGTTIALEAPTEVFQSVLERAQAGLSLTSDDAFAEYGDAAYQAALIGPVGAVGRLADRSAARQQVAGTGIQPGEPEYTDTSPTDVPTIEEARARTEELKAAARARREGEVAPEETPEQGEAAKAAEATTTTEEAGAPPPPSGIITADQLKTLGLKKNFGVHNRIFGKDVNDPEQRDYVIANIDDYIKNNRGSEESRAALGEYRNILAGMSEAKDAGEAVTETGGVGVSVAGEPGAGTTPGEPGASVPSGVVSPTEDAEPTDRGARQQPGAVASVQRARPSGAEAFEPELIEKLRTPDYKSREKLIEMPIDDFLALAKDVTNTADSSVKLRRTRKLLKEDTKFYSLPFLNVEDSGQVTGHEGRHRALALKEAGYETMPVILRSANIRWSEQSDPDRFDYQEKWPTKLLAETGAKDKGFSVPFPVTREEATAPYQSGAVASVQREAPETPEFKSWFGDSKVVDEAGKPLVVYHGTNADITEFRPSKFGSLGEGIYFTSDPKAASNFATGVRGSRTEAKFQGNVVPTYLSIEQPFDDNFFVGNKDWQDWALSKVVGGDINNIPSFMLETMHGGVPREYLKELIDKLQSGTATISDITFIDKTDRETPWKHEIFDAVKKHGGFDGIVLKGSPKGFDEYLVFDPTKIKSATGNRGTYSRETGDITKTERAPGALRGAVIPELTTAAEKGDTKSALNIVAEHRKTSELDKLVARRLRQMSTLPRIEVAPADQVEGDAQYDPATDTVRIAEGQVDSHTVLHEITHGALHKLILLNMQGKRNDPGYNDLKKLYEHIQKERPDLSKTYGMKNVSEFASEAMSNPEFQDILSKIEYKAQTALQWFGKAVRKLLGIPQREESALTEALIAIDKTIFEGRRVQRTEGADAGVLPVQRRRVQAPPAPAGAQPPAAPPPAQPPAAPGAVPVPSLPPRQPTPGRPARLVGEPEKLSAIKQVSAAVGPNKVIGIRAKFFDSLAGMANVFAQAYRNRVKDNTGNYNPEMLVSRAIDAARFGLEVLRTGTAVLQPGGLVEVAELNYGQNGQTISYEKDVAEAIVAEAKRRGVSTKKLQNEIDDLLAGHREYELMNSPEAADIDFFYTPQEAAAIEQRFRNDAFAVEISKRLDAIRFSLIDLMVATQRLTPEQGQIWKDNSGYVPFGRIDKFDEYARAISGIRTQKGGVAASKSIKPYSGSETKQIESPIESFAKTAEWMVKESMKNEANRRALTELEMLGFAQYVPSRDAFDNNKQGAIVDAYVNGVKQSYYVPDPAIFAGFLVEEKEVSRIMAALQGASRVLRTGVTVMPPFAIKQIMDDVTRAYAYSGVNNPLPMAARALMNMPINWFNEIRGKQSASIRDLSRKGIIATYDYSGKSNIKDIFEESGLEKRSIGTAIYRVLEAGAKASDISIREAIYNQTIAETKSAAMPDGDKALAEHRAREIINFSRRGSAKSMDFMIRVVPFFNAYARGMDKLALAAAGNNVAKKALGLSTTGAARAMFRNRMLMLTAMGFAYAMLMSDDEEYQKLDDHIRDRNWVLPAGKAFVEKYGFVPTISIPAELAFFFKAIPERFVQYFKLQGTDQERDAMTMVREMLLNGVDVFTSPNVTPQLLKPLFENYVNYSFFLNRPLESQMQLNYRPVLREGRGTSEISKKIAEKLDDLSSQWGIEALQVSPIKIDNLLRGLFGTTAGTVMAFTDGIINPSRTDRPIHQQLGSQLTGISAFMKDGVGTRFITDIYKLDRSVEQASKTVDKYIKDGKPDRAQEVLDNNFGLISVRPIVQAIMNDIRDFNRMASEIDKMTGISPEERFKAISELVTLQNNIAKDVYMVRKLAAQNQLETDKANGLKLPANISVDRTAPQTVAKPENKTQALEEVEEDEEDEEE